MSHFFRHALVRSALFLAFAGTVRLSAGDDTSSASPYSDAQSAFVRGWIMEKAPECPPDVADASATQFLDDLKTNQPAAFDQLLLPEFPSAKFESSLLRDVSAHLAGPSWTSLKERLAVLRVSSLLGAGSPSSANRAEDASAIVDHLKKSSDDLYRRILSGKIEDDDLLYLMSKGHAPDAGSSIELPQKKILTADDIVSEYSRHNQDGSSLEKLRAYVFEGDVEAKAGNSHIILFKLRPDYVRIVVTKDGLTRSVTAGHAGQYWRQAPGGEPQDIGASARTELETLGEFADPLYAEGDYVFASLPDGSTSGGPCYRISVKRPGAPGYVAVIDPSTFHQIGREDANGVVSTMSDFRKVAGVTVAFRQEADDGKGNRTVLQMTRFTPNPGLTEVLFSPPTPHDQGYFNIERLIARAASEGSRAVR
jgi:hypothetical protein